MRTDLDEAEARAATDDFESAYDVLEQVAFPGVEDASPPQRLNVVVFRAPDEFHAFWPQPDLGGFYTDRLPQEIERSPTIVFFGTLYGETRRTFLHELTHRFLRRAYGWTPIWMNEGLAQYFSTMRVQHGVAYLGEAPPIRESDLRFVPTLREITSADRATFYGGGWTDARGSDGRSLYYLGAWALVHFFRNGPDSHRARFEAFVRAMNSGARPDEAWRSTIGAMPPDALERAFRDYVAQRSEWDLAGKRVNPSSAAGSRERPMADDEVHLLWLRVARTRAEVGAQVAAAAALAPRSPEVAYVGGCLALGQAHLEVARASFEAALAIAPDEPRYLFGLIVSRLRAEGPAAAHDPVFNERIDRLTRTAQSPDELVLGTALLASRGDYDGALRLVDSALAIDPGNYAALAARARVRYATGHYAEAVEDQERAVVLVPEQVVDRSLLSDLATYRGAWLSARP